ncbi:MAG: hypothetical protein ACPF8W_00750 [Luminiphilus sp.]
MAVRFYSRFTSDNGTDYGIRIYDNDFSGVSTEVTAATPGFTLTYEGNNQEQYQPIIASRVDFTLYNEGGNFNTWLNDVLPAADEDRFLIEIVTDPAEVGEAVFWRGIMLADQLQMIDEPYPSAVNFTASDDLGQLKEVTFDELTPDAAVDRTVRHRTHQILSLVRYKSLYADDDIFFRYIDDIKPDAYTGNDWFGSAGFYDPYVPGTSPVEYYNCFDVLRSIAITHNARVFQAGGIFYFLPLNVFQRRSDGDSTIYPDMHQLAADRDVVTWSLLDKTSWYIDTLYTDGSVINKMAGNTIEYSAPVKRVDRIRVTRGSEFLFQENTGFTTMSGSADDITFADDDRVYFAGSTHLITVNYNLDIAAVASDNNFINFHTVRAQLTIKFGDQYYTDTGWTGTAGTKNVVIGTYYKSAGFEDIGQISVQVPELVDDEVGLDITLNVQVLNGAGGEITGSLPTHSALFILRVFPGDSSDSIGDEIVYSSETNLNNQVRITQDAVITGNAPVTYTTGSAGVEQYNGGYHATGIDMDDWVSSQTTTPYSLNRLGVREIMYNTQLPHRVRQGTFYIDTAMEHIWPYTLLREDSEDHAIHEMSFNANDSEVTIERWQLNADTTNLTFRTDSVKNNNPRDRFAPSGSTIINRFSDAIDERFRHSTAQFYAVKLLEHDAGDTYQIDDDDSDGFIYMNKWVGAGTGTSTVYLPKVADNEGRLFRFKSDGSIAATKKYQVEPYPSDYTAGVRVDGGPYYRGSRDYDGVTMLCYDGQWYVIQNKEK